MAKSESKKISSNEERINKWKQSAIDNCIIRGLLEIRAEKQQEKIERLKGIIQDLSIDNRYLQVVNKELNHLIIDLEFELKEYYEEEEEEYDNEKYREDDEEDWY